MKIIPIHPRDVEPEVEVEVEPADTLPARRTLGHRVPSRRTLMPRIKF